MNMADLIVKKRDGGRLSEKEIRDFVREYTNGNIPDYQASALLMAIFFRHMDKEETFVLTDAMRYSGNTVDLSGIQGIKVDKHSTGGVGDKTTLIAGPLAAACRVPVAKMSGRGLGFTGGTVDKLESIPGFRTKLDGEDFIRQVNETGIAVIGQTEHITPADKKLYALRDVTGTVENLSLIASSIMSKKLASGSDAIVLDVKCGNGAFMKSQEDAEALGTIMCEIGKSAGRKTVAVITDMSQPLGQAVGNSLEVIEAIETLKGNGPEDITELSERLAGMMIYLGGRAKSPEDGYLMAGQALHGGAGLRKFANMIKMQGGNPDVINDYSLLGEAGIKIDIVAENGGYVESISAEKTGIASQHTGAGREKKEDSVDLTAGIYLHRKKGDKVNKGDVLATVYGNDKKKTAFAAEEMKEAFSITREKVKKTELVKKIIEVND